MVYCRASQETGYSFPGHFTGADNGVQAHQGTSTRRKDHRQRGLFAERPRQSDYSVHRGRRDRRRYHAGHAEGRRCGGGQGLRRQAQDQLDGNLRRREGRRALRRRLVPRRDAGRHARIRGLDQGSADHARGRRLPFAERGAAPGARSLCLPAPGALVHRRALAGARARQDQHGDLPRELRRHLRRHRVEGRLGRRRQGDQVPARGNGRHQDPLPRELRHRHQAGVRRQAPSAWCAARSSTRSTRIALGDHRAQGQHHEVHRGWLQGVGLRAGAVRSSAASCSTAARG